MNKLYSTPPLGKLEKYESWREQWENPLDLNLFSYLRSECHPEDTLIVSKLLLPDMLCVDGGVFLEFSFNESTYRSLKEKGECTSSMERSMNHTLLYDMCDGCSSNVSDEVFVRLSALLKYSWGLVLRDRFPEKLFSITIENNSGDYGPSITFWQCGA
ncbi:hypothetical protein LOY46_11515 [Pseudomonas sichuanensis]|uniref:hypothetical protein n=1 Tax=Pseudomonas sichuanensis TaxID=2213015 RepID=UPI0021609072|nr:hypothetical protein [Pseudomonas sichuanensis]UVK85271.1 hypothetical protein LOY46_11515 [Pseudomonas sichuanensis]